MPIKRLILLVLLLLAAVPADANTPRRWQMCESGRAGACRTIVPERVGLTAPQTTLVTTVHIAPSAAGQPLAVDIDAMASALVRWNGVVIGANGLPGVNPTTEVPGRYSASILVPPRLVRAGDNRVEIVLSSQHLWLPVAQPIHRIAIGPRQDAHAYTLRHYLPALATLALPAGALLVLIALLVAGRVGRAVLPAITVLALVVVQGLIEISKIVVSYSYPWHLARLVVLIILTAIVGLLLVWMATRLLTRLRSSIVVAATGVAMLAACLFVGGMDQKSLAVFEIAMLATATIAAPAAVRRDRWAIALGLTAISLAAWAHIDGPDFLDGAYYVAAAIGALALGLAVILRPVPVGEVSIPTPEIEPSVTLRDGARQHVIVPSQLVFLKADDDYCSLHLADGREIMVTMTLKAVLALMPAEFVRIHRSHAINIRNLHGTRAGSGGRVAELAGGTLLPIGRAYAATLRAEMDAMPAMAV